MLKPMFTDPELEGIDPLNSVDYYNLTIRDRWGHILHSSNGKHRLEWHVLWWRKGSYGTYLLEVSTTQIVANFKKVYTEVFLK